MADKAISLEVFEKYHSKVIAEYFEPISDELDDKVIIAIFDIVAENTLIRLSHIGAPTLIDWGDGTVNTELEHTYTTIGKYRCKIYGLFTIKASAFYNCGNLVDILIPEGFTEIGVDAFRLCSNLYKVRLPDSIQIIRKAAFYNCKKLKYVYIGSKITSIGDSVFEQDSGMHAVYIEALTPPAIGTKVFETCYAKVIVDPHALNAYKTTWSSYTSRIDSYALASQIANNTAKLYKHTLTFEVNDADAGNVYVIEFLFYSSNAMAFTPNDYFEKFGTKYNIARISDVYGHDGVGIFRLTSTIASVRFLDISTGEAITLTSQIDINSSDFTSLFRDAVTEI